MTLKIFETEKDFNALSQQDKKTLEEVIDACKSRTTNVRTFLTEVKQAGNYREVYLAIELEPTDPREPTLNRIVENLRIDKVSLMNLAKYFDPSHPGMLIAANYFFAILEKNFLVNLSYSERPKKPMYYCTNCDKLKDSKKCDEKGHKDLVLVEYKKRLEL